MFPVSTLEIMIVIDGMSHLQHTVAIFLGGPPYPLDPVSSILHIPNCRSRLRSRVAPASAGWSVGSRSPDVLLSGKGRLRKISKRKEIKGYGLIWGCELSLKLEDVLQTQ